MWARNVTIMLNTVDIFQTVSIQWSTLDIGLLSNFLSVLLEVKYLLSQYKLLNCSLLAESLHHELFQDSRPVTRFAEDAGASLLFTKVCGIQTEPFNMI